MKWNREETEYGRDVIKRRGNREERDQGGEGIGKI